MFIFYFVYTKQQVLLICNENEKFMLPIWWYNRGSFPLGNEYFMVFVLNGLLFRGSHKQGCRFSDFCRNSDFFRRSDFLCVCVCVCACIVCVTNMRVNWWLSGQFWMRKSSSFRGLCPLGPPLGRCPWNPLGALPPDPWSHDTFLLFWTVLVASLHKADLNSDIRN